MANKPKLELTWIGKGNRTRLEPRILIEDTEKSYHAKYRVRMGSGDEAGMGIGPREDTKNAKETDSSKLRAFAASRETDVGDIFDNMLIHGDNLLALKALEQEYTGRVKCIYIDPPFNTGEAFEHYDDGI